MTKYEIVKEYTKMSTKINENEIIECLIEEGIGNSYKEVIKIVETEKEAFEELKKHKCTSKIVGSYSSRVRECEIIYTVRTEDGEWTDEFEFAEIE